MSFINQKHNNSKAAFFILVISLYCLYIGEFSLKAIRIYGFLPELRPSALSKILIELVLIGGIILSRKKEAILQLTALGLFSSLILVSNYLYVDHQLHLFLENVIYLNKVFYIFIVYIFYHCFFSVKDISRFEPYIDYLFSLNTLLIIIGQLFSLLIFKTYRASPWRSGYDGFIYAQNEASLFLLLTVAYGYFKYFILKEKNLRYLLMVLSVIVLGTKSGYIIIFVFLTHFLYLNRHKTTLIISTVGLSLVGTGAFIYLSLLKPDTTVSYFYNFFKSDGLLFALTSGRNTLFTEEIPIVLHNWKPFQYLFGGLKIPDNLVEMDFIDMWLLMGTIGAPIYLFYYAKIGLPILNSRNSFLIVVSFTYLFIAFFAGHFFVSATNAITQFILFHYFVEQYKQKHEYRKLL